MGRLNFLVRGGLLNGLVYWAGLQLEETGLSSAEGIGLAAVAICCFVYGLIYVYLPRVRDCGLPPWTLILSLVPFVRVLYGLILLLGPSKSGLSESTGPDERELDSGPPTIAGATCSVCGDGLLLATDGIVTDSQYVVCNRCAVSTK